MLSIDISEDKVIAAAKQFIALGLKEAGYQYINIDVSPGLTESYTLTKMVYRIAGLRGRGTLLDILSLIMRNSLKA